MNAKDRAAAIIQTISHASGVSPRDLRSKSRKAPIVCARHLAMVLIRELTDLTLAETGRLFNRDHGAVHWAVQSINDRIETDLPFSVCVQGWLDVLRK